MPAPLTARSVELARADPAKRREIPDGALPGLYLVVQPSGSKSWATRYRFAGASKKLTLGPYPLLSLADARAAARAALQAVGRGQDPARDKAAKDPGGVARQTFGAIAAEYIQRHARAHHRTWSETERLLLRADLAAWRDRDLHTIGRRDVLDVIDTIIDRGSAIQANRLLTRLKPFFHWAVARGILDASPTAGLRPPAPETARDRVLTDAELTALWRAAAGLGYPFGTAVHLLILTGARRSEVLEAEWPEIDLGGRLWTIPRALEDRCGPSGPAVRACPRPPRRLPRIGDPASPFLFTTTGQSPFSGVSKVLERLNARAADIMPDGEPLKPWRLHDLRRTFASGCARLGVPVHVVEKALNHTGGTFGGIVGVYQRHEFLDERRHAMEVWAAHVLRLVAPMPSQVVVLTARDRR